MNSKTISKIVASVLPVVCLSVHNAPNCYAGELLKEIKKRQDSLLLLGSTHSRTQILQKVIKNYDVLNEKLKDALDTLWFDDAGKLLLRSLCKEIKLDSQRITIMWNTRCPDGKTNLFCLNNSTVYIDASEFSQYVGYCNGNFTELPETLDTVLFHELCHGLHKLKGEKQFEQHRVVPRLCELSDNTPICNLINEAWTDDEEIYTETGWYINSKNELDFDYLNTNSYMILKALKNDVPPQGIAQRIFHCDFSLWKAKYAFMQKIPGINLEKFLIETKKYLDE